MSTARYVVGTVVFVVLLHGTALWAQPAFPVKGMDAVNALYAGVNPQDDDARRIAIRRTCEQLAADLGPRWGGKKRAGLPDDFRSPDSLAFHEEDGSVSVWDIQASSGAILVHAGKTPDYPRLPASDAAFMPCEPKNHLGAPVVANPPPPQPPPVIVPPVDLSTIERQLDTLTRRVEEIQGTTQAIKEDTAEIRSGMNRVLRFTGKYIVPIVGAIAATWYAKPEEQK